MRREKGLIYLCKSDIRKNFSYLAKRGFAGFSIVYLEREFDNYLAEGNLTETFITGSNFDARRQRHTRFIEITRFYRYCVKG